MPLVLADRVRDTTTTTGTGTVTLSGTAPTGYQSFAVIGNGNTTYYTINAGSQWEVGIGTYSSTGPTLARNTVLESSNSNALVDFAAGTKDVFVTYPADKSVNYDESNNVGIGTTTSSAKLNVNADSGAPAILLTNSVTSNPSLQFANGSFIQGIGIGGAQDLRFRAGGTTGPLLFDTNFSERMRITAAGDVGIGTSFPDAKLTVSGAISASLGAVGTPSYTFTGDLNTGMWSPAADTVAVSTAGTERMRITSAGLVQINTTSGGAQLNVNSSSGAPSILLTNSATSNPWLQFANGNYIMGISDGTMRLYTAGAHAMTFGTDNTDRMRITAAGDVGIGTSFPAQRLDVLSSGDTPAVFRSAGANTYLQFVNSVASAGYIGYSGSALTFWTGPERMRITAAGNVGVGTSAPVNKLESVYNVPVSVPATGTVGGHGFAVGGIGFGIAAGALNNGNGYLQVTQWDGTSANYNLLLQPNGGNVGIGTSTPAAKLDVQGTDGTSGIIVRDSATTNIFDVAPIASNGALVRVFDNTGVSRVQFTAYGASYFNAGNVGIGTTSPGSALTVARGAGSGAEIAIQANGNSAAAQFVLSQDSGSATYLYNRANQFMSFGTNNTERMRITAAGDVGIGTSSPAGRLAVASATGNTGFNTGTSSSPERGNLWYDTDGTGWKFNIGKLQSGAFTAQMTFQDNGNVGIGTTSPSTPLTVAGAVTVNNGVLDLTSGFSLRWGSGASAIVGSSGNGDMVFTVGSAERFRVNGSSGNVGFGTSSPAGRVHAFNSYSNSSDATFVAEGNIPGLNIRSSAGGRFSILSNFGAANTTSIALGTGTNNPTTEAMRFDHATGNIGIGTISPDAKLDVLGASSDQLRLRTAETEEYRIGRNSSTGLLDFYGSQTGFTGYTFGGIDGERMRIDSSGRVGIGTSAPNANLQIVSASTTVARLTTTGAATQAELSFGSVGGSALVSLDQSGNLVTRTQQGSMFFDNFGAGGSINFRTGGANTRFSISNTGAITSSDLADAVGYKGLPPNAQGSGYTLVLADQGKMVTITGGVTIPANGSVAFPVGTTVVIYNNSASNQTISITTDTLRLAGTATTGARTLAQRGFATCIKVAATEWVVTGNVT